MQKVVVMRGFCRSCPLVLLWPTDGPTVVCAVSGRQSVGKHSYSTIIHDECFCRHDVFFFTLLLCLLLLLWQHNTEYFLGKRASDSPYNIFAILFISRDWISSKVCSFQILRMKWYESTQVFHVLSGMIFLFCSATQHTQPPVREWLTGRVFFLSVGHIRSANYPYLSFSNYSAFQKVKQAMHNIIVERGSGFGESNDCERWSAQQTHNGTIRDQKIHQIIVRYFICFRVFEFK